MKTIRNRLSSICLVLVMLMGILPISTLAVESDIWDGTVASGFASGSGTEADPYIIKTPEQLAYLASSVNAGTTYSGKYIKLANDIYLNDTTNWENWDTTAPTNTWTPIGTSSTYSFSGTFDGAGHEISGIYINSAVNNVGLFGGTRSGTIQNLGVIESYINGKGQSVGGVVGSNCGTVKDCYNTGTVMSTNHGNYSSVGGIVGGNYGTAEGCYNIGDVSGTSTYVGGVVGYNCASYGTAIVTECYNTGDVSGTSTCVGGIVGYNYSYIEGTATVTDCYNTGDVSGDTNVGGVVGLNAVYDVNLDGTAIVTDCYNTGDVSGERCVGGVVGSSSKGTVENCSNTGDVSGERCVGGVVGDNSAFYYSATVKKCYNTGIVSGTDYVGGVVGDNYQEATVEDSFNTGNVLGTDYVGGVVGDNYRSTVKYCYNIGMVAGDTNVGGFIGEFHNVLSTLTRAYYLTGCAKDGSDTVQYGVGTGTKGSTKADVSGETKGLSDDKMKLKASFVGFDFTDVWAIDSQINNGYPYLIDNPPTADSHTHSDADNDWESNETYHWHVCATCPKVLDKAIHTDHEVAGICDVCGEAFETIKNGLWSDDRFYENNVLITNYRIYEYDGDTYFIGDYNRITKSQALYLTNGVNGWTGATGYYGFDEDGKLCVAGSGNVVCAPYAFTDGIQVKAYGAFETRDGEWYFVNDGYRIATNKAFRIQLPSEASLRYHYFGVDGKLYAEDPVMFGDRIYIDGVQQGYGLYLAYEVKADGTLADEAKYYYVNDYHIIARDKWLYVNNPEFGVARQYYFDANGYIDTEKVK